MAVNSADRKPDVGGKIRKADRSISPPWFGRVAFAVVGSATVAGITAVFVVLCAVLVRLFIPSVNGWSMVAIGLVGMVGTGAACWWSQPVVEKAVSRLTSWAWRGR